MKWLRILAAVPSLLVLVTVLSGCACPSAGPVTTSKTAITPDSILWESMGGLPGTGCVNELIQSSSGDHELYALTIQRDLYKSEDKGENWQLITDLEDIEINSIATYKDKLFIGGDGVKYYGNKGNLVRVFDGWCQEMIVSDDKLFVIQLGKDVRDLRILFTDLTTGEFSWEDIAFSASDLSDLSMPPSDKGLKCGISIPDIHAYGERIRNTITCYLSQDAGQAKPKL